ncbi:hypothetical protein [Pseudofrankia sp. BMG5.37]|uniref:hypothetical protein n=1 Tax=Pseudofrankia sp. BMG5.37 TaxID=3050035 RepID=UPI002894E845|nr:hypothetical protein [Pseudofrankia sp. BMG5.37]MDT3442750.1 hypothetical protein [Pseudofrankia sp. BMG5.37]
MMTDEQLADLLRRTADRVPVNARLTDLVQARVRRARRRRRAGAIASAAAGVVVVLVAVVALVAGPVRHDSGPRPEPPATGVDAWRWRDLPSPRPLMFGDTERTLVVGHSLVVLGREPTHWTAVVSDPVGAPFGARDPAPDTWMTQATVAVSDTTVYLWGGSIVGSTNGGAYETGSDLAFDVATRTWSKLPPAPIESRTGAVAVWTGKELVVWGGSRELAPRPDGQRTQVFTDGAAYDPSTRAWTVLPPVSVPASLVPVKAVAASGKVVIWAQAEGRGSDPAEGRTLVYDPATRQWTVAPGPPLTTPAGGTGLVTTTDGPVAVAATLSSAWHNRPPAAARFDVAAETWTPLRGPSLPPDTLCGTTVVPLRDLAAATTVAAVIPNCGGAFPQVLDPTRRHWVPLAAWGADKALAGVPSSGDAFLTSDKLPATQRPSRPGAQILAP